MMIYDYQDADGFERGDMGKGKPKVKRIYKLISIDDKTRMARVMSENVWSDIIREVFPIHTIKPLDKPIER